MSIRKLLMVYRIKPFASHLNDEIDLGYQRSPGAQGSWARFVENEKPVPQEYAPTLVVSEREKPLPDAFEISRHFWCVSARVREMMEKLFGSQVAFFEVPVVTAANKASLPSTHFVTFSEFHSLIDWSKSKIRARPLSTSMSDAEAIVLADVRGAAVFTAMPNDRDLIWIERSFWHGNRFFMPGVDVYATNEAARSITEVFPKIFIMTEFEESPVSKAGTK